jgi:hypothetical protein
MKANNNCYKASLTILAALTAQACTVAGELPDEGYVAHEWGTFTSVQGADGVPQPWHPLITAELPSFVYDRSGGKSPRKEAAHYFDFGKGSYTALQRLETPVIYFYSARERTVDANVLFPKGQFTEWYPTATGPATEAMGPMEMLRYGNLCWHNVHVLPSSSAGKSPTPPEEPGGSHYYAARATDANLLHVNGAGENKVETEKFLFYRGVGWFTTPLRVSMAADESYLELSNQGAQPLAHLFIVEMRQAKGRFKHLAKLDVDQTERVVLDTEMCDGAQASAGLAEEMRAALTSDGLYPREAAAIVATWNESWFNEDGLRVLYLLPRQWTEQILPLELKPAPRQLVRTMLGRAEVLRPSVERQLAEQLERFGAPASATRQQAVAATRALGLGRFLEPALRLVQKQSKESQELANQLLEAAGKPGKVAQSAARPEKQPAGYAGLVQ